MNRIVHFEIHAKDLDKLQKFYQDVFGWSFENMGEQMGGYRMVITGKSKEGEVWPGINGGMTPRGGSTLPVQGDAVNAYVCTIEVEDIEAIISKIAKSGGTEAVEKMDVPGAGLLSYQKDPEGNIFGILQPTLPIK